MKEKADPVGVAAAAQRVRDRDEMIVVDPDQVIGLDDLFELGREMFVHAHISAEIPTREVGEIKPEMQDRPQDPIGEAVVVFLVVVLGEVGDHISNFFVRDRVQFDVRGRHDIAAPAEPHSPVTLQRRAQGDFEATGALCAIASRDTHSI
jgi:hypothetical protein